MPGQCKPSQYTPVYDDRFYADIADCPKSPASLYCICYEQATVNSLARQQAGNVDIFQQARQSLHDKLYPKQTVVQGPPLNVPSRADQKKNIFTKAFNPANRKIIVLLIAAFLIFIAATSYD